MNALWELREFSNFAKTRVRMLFFHMFHFTMLLTSGRMCCYDILMSVFTTLIFFNLNPSARQILRDSFFPVQSHHLNSIKRLIPSYWQQEVFFCLHSILLNTFLSIQNTEFRSRLGLPFILPWIRLLKMVVHVKRTQIVEHDSKLNDICHSMCKESMLGHIPVKSISGDSKVFE